MDDKWELFKRVIKYKTKKLNPEEVLMIMKQIETGTISGET